MATGRQPVSGFKRGCRCSRSTYKFLVGESSVNTNPVVIRRILGQLKQAGLVTVRAAAGGTYLACPAAAITLLDVYRAVEATEACLFSLHDQPNPRCLVGRNIQQALQGTLDQAQQALERQLAGVTVAQLAAEMTEAGS